MPRAHRTIAIALVAGMAVTAAARRYLPDLLSQFRYEDDARQHVWWTYRFADPELFPNDPAAEYFSRLTFAPPGYQALAFVFVPFVDAQVFSEVVPCFLTAAVAVLAWLLGRSVSGGSLLGATTAAAFALLGGVLARVEGGLPRAWAMPVLLFGLWAVLEKRWITFGASLLAAALFYPPLLVSLGAVGGLALAIEVLRTRRLPARWPGMIAFGVLALAVAIFAYGQQDEGAGAHAGRKPTEAEAREMPEFGPEGRSWFFSEDPVAHYVMNERSGLGMPWEKVAIAVAAVALSVLVFPGAVPLVAWLIPLTSLAAFVAAHALLFELHLPSRYTRFTLPAFAMLWVAAILPAALAAARRRPAAAGVLAVLERPRVLASLAAIAVLGLAARAASELIEESDRKPRNGWPEVVAFLSGLPRDTLIAAHPAVASDIPLLARRSVLACEETSTPYDLAYYGEMKERLLASLSACYASDWSAIDRLFQRYGAALFVADMRRYRRPFDPAATYYEPFRSRIAGPAALAARTGFALESPPEERVLLRAGDFVVVKLAQGR